MHKRTIWPYLCALGAAVSSCLLIGLAELAQSQDQITDLIISEVAWSGTAASGADEWIELHNRSHLSVDVNGWVLNGGELEIELSGSVAPYGFFLLERTDDDTVSDIPAVKYHVLGVIISVSVVNVLGFIIYHKPTLPTCLF